MEQFDETILTAKSIQEKTIKGIAFSIVATGIKTVLNLGSTIFLARMLDPLTFGAFGIITFICLQVPTVIYDLGLPDALVQKKSTPQEDEIGTIFTVNTGMAVLFIALIFLLSPFLAHYYSIDSLGPWLFRIFSFIIVIFLIEEIPLMFCRRVIGFDVLAKIGLVEVIVYNVVTVTLAFLGFGVLSLILGMLISRLSGVLLLCVKQPWRIHFGFDLRAIGQSLHFGLFYRGSTVIGLFGLAIVPLLVGSISGLTAVGYFGFGDRITNVLLLIPGILNMILFSTLSRLQDDRMLFKKVIEKSFEWMSVLIFPIVGMGIALGPQIISFFFTDKWIPGLGVYYWSIATVVVTCFAGIMSQALYASGYARAMFRVVLLQIIVQWVLSVSLLSVFGFNGVAAARFIASLTGFLSLLLLKKDTFFNPTGIVVPYGALSIVVGVAVRILVPHVVRGVVTMALLTLCGACVYMILLIPMRGKLLLKDSDIIKKLLFAQK